MALNSLLVPAILPLFLALLISSHVYDDKTGMWVGYHFCVCPFSKFLSLKSQPNNNKKLTVQQNTNSIPTVWQVTRSPEIK